ncbi:hypothetical protein ACWHAM_26050 [Paenibacillus terrae]
MKRLIAAVILLMLIGTFLLAYRGQSTEEHTGFTTHRVISHAKGSVDGLAYTNAREAMELRAIQKHPHTWFLYSGGLE